MTTKLDEARLQQLRRATENHPADSGMPAISLMRDEALALIEMAAGAQSSGPLNEAINEAFRAKSGAHDEYIWRECLAASWCAYLESLRPAIPSPVRGDGEAPEPLQAGPGTRLPHGLGSTHREALADGDLLGEMNEQGDAWITELKERAESAEAREAEAFRQRDEARRKLRAAELKAGAERVAELEQFLRTAQHYTHLAATVFDAAKLWDPEIYESTEPTPPPSQGSGEAKAGAGRRDCPKCTGTGQAYPFSDLENKCWACGGTGYAEEGG
jgi:hypothetical protein